MAVVAAVVESGWIDSLLESQVELTSLIRGHVYSGLSETGLQEVNLLIYIYCMFPLPNLPSPSSHAHPISHSLLLPTHLSLIHSLSHTHITHLSECISLWQLPNCCSAPVEKRGCWQEVRCFLCYFHIMNHKVDLGSILCCFHQVTKLVVTGKRRVGVYFHPFIYEISIPPDLVKATSLGSLYKKHNDIKLLIPPTPTPQ